MVTKFAPLPLAICLATVHLVLCQTTFDDDYSVNDLDDYQIYERGYDTFEDDAIDQTYFDPYIGDYDDPYGDSILQDLAVVKDCQIAADGSPTFNGSSLLVPDLSAEKLVGALHPQKHNSQGAHAGSKPCDIQIQGVDKSAPGLAGGMDGVYKVLTCENGRPMYKRDTPDKAGQTQVLAYTKEAMLGH